MSRAQRGLRRLVIMGCLLASAAAWGQDLGPPKVALSLTVEQAMLIVQTLGQIQCQSVAAMATCVAASELIKEIRDQVKPQQK